MRRTLLLAVAPVALAIPLAASAAPTAVQPVVIQINVVNGKVIGGAKRPSVKKGRTVRFVVRTNVGTVGTLEDIMFGPSHNADGTTNYIGALRRAMATAGYVDLKSFQRCPVTVAPTR